MQPPSLQEIPEALPAISTTTTTTSYHHSITIMSGNTIALFGATGNVGKELLKVLTEKAPQQDFLVFSRTEGESTGKVQTKALPKDEQGATDTDALAELLSSAKVETIFLCIPQLLVAGAKKYVDDLIPAWKKGGVVRVVKVGTGNPSTYEYGRRHVASEDAIRKAGLKLTVLEGGSYSTNPQWLGPSPPGAPYLLVDVFKGLSYLSYVGLGVFRSMGNVACFTKEDLEEPFVDLRDFAEALAVVLLDSKKHEGKTYRIYSEGVTPKEIAAVYGELLGRKFHVLTLSDDEISALMEMNGFKDEMLELIMDMFTNFRNGVFQTDETWNGYQEITGKKPRTFKDFAKEIVGAKVKPIPLPF